MAAMKTMKLWLIALTQIIGIRHNFVALQSGTNYRIMPGGHLRQLLRSNSAHASTKMAKAPHRQLHGDFEA